MANRIQDVGDVSVTWKILVIDDDEEDFLIAKEMLKGSKGRKFEVHWANTYTAGQEELMTHKYHAVLVDYDLGAHTGIDLIRAANERGSIPPLILFTGRGSYEVDMEAMQAGATLYLTKGETSALMLERAIRYAIEHKQTEQALITANEQLQEQAEELEIQTEELRAQTEEFIEANRKLAYQTGLLAQVQDAITATDVQWRATYWNKEAETIFGWTEAEVMGKYLPDLFRSQFSNDSREKVRNELYENGNWEGEVIYHRKDGTTFSAQVRTAKFHSPGGDLIGYVSSIRDISKRKQAEVALLGREKALLESEARLRSFLDNSQESFFILDRNWRFQYVNPRFTELLHRSLEDLIGVTFWEAFPDYLGTPAEQHYHRAMEERMPVHFEMGGVYTPVWYDISVYPTAEGIGVFAIDRSAEKKAREELRESEQKFRALFENSPEAIFLTYPDGSVEAANPAVCSMFGWSEEEIRRLGRAGLLDPDDPRLATALEERQLMGRFQGREYTAIRKGGERFPVEVDSVILEGEPQRSFVIMRDITERKRVSAMLDASERKSRELIQYAPSAIYEIDFRTQHLTAVNDATVTMTGFSRDELLQMSAFDLLEEQSRRVQEERIRQWQMGQQPAKNVEYRVKTKGGRLVDAIVNTSFHLDENGRPLSATVVAHDITERKQMEQALVESEKRLRRLVEGNIIGINVRDAAGHILDANAAFLQMIGYTCDDLENEKIVIQQITPPVFWEVDQQAVEEAKSVGSCKPYEKEYLHKDRHPIPALVAYTRLDENEDRYIGFILDLTERKQAQTELQEYAEKLKQSNQELEQFAFVASHDLQEPLRKIKMFGNAIQHKLQGTLDEGTQENFDRMLNATERMQTMIRDLLDLSRVNTQGRPFEQVDLNQIAAEVVSDLEPRIQRTGGKVVLEDLPTIAADPIQIQEVLQNLISNGLKFHKPDIAPIVKVSSTTSSSRNKIGEMISIQVQDNGIGFDQKLLEEILQPFRRLHSRGEYEGTGIGLAIVKKIVDRHSGEITAQSSPGEGATFIVTLPRTRTA